MLQFGSKIGRREILNCIGDIKVHKAHINLDELVQSVRRKAEVIGRPLKKRELLSLLASMFSN